MRTVLKCLCIALGFALSCEARAEKIRIVADQGSAPRIGYGVTRLSETLRAAGHDVTEANSSTGGLSGVRSVVVGQIDSPAIKALVEAGRLKIASGELRPEGFILASVSEGSLAVVGADASGVLYGCLELASRVREAKELPASLRIVDAPAFKLRGPCIGMQKTYILPGRHVYEYPYTSDLFPFFYDKAYWKEQLDFLADHRMNTLYLWNGHPFASLVKLADYAYALEVSEEQFQKNVEMFRYVAEEADKRGIWVVQMFYNIILSKPFAEKHGLPTQMNKIDPIAADYTRKSIAEFVRQYPNVGLMVCLGEALQDVPQQKTWCTDVILAGVKDGMKAAGLKQEPPVVIRSHATDVNVVMPAALAVYKNLYTEAKFNGESLTTWEPRGTWQKRHRDLSALGSTHVVNVHILANLEPFRYGAQRFIKKSAQASRDRLGGRGLHIYPLAYWNWPDSPDKTDVPLKQLDRDWIWFEAWSRYAWNPDIEESTDRAYWVARLTEKYGTKAAAEKILEAYNDSGECAPRILRRFGITEGNRQTMSLGMTLDQLVTPAKYRPYDELWKSQSPPGERLDEYVERETNKQPHEGETPPQIVREILDYSARAVAALDAAAPHVTKNREEFERLRNDVRCIRAMSQNYAAKAEAAERVLRYEHTHNLSDMDEAQRLLSDSLEHYRTLAALTRETYRFANTMQTSQRRIPVTGGVGGKPANFHWVQLLELYEKEFTDFKAKVTALKEGGAAARRIVKLRPAPFRVLTPGAEIYGPQQGSRAFSDQPNEIQSVATEILGLRGIRFSYESAKTERYVPIEIETDEPVQVLLGYFQSKEKGWLQVPDLETDATAADRVVNEPLLVNAMSVDGMPPINIHVMKLPKGRSKIEPRGTGSFLILGVAAADSRPAQ